MARLAADYNNSPSSHVPSNSSTQAHFDDDTDSVLDDDILESSAMPPTPTHGHRRLSFPHHQGPIYSPRTGRIVAFPFDATTADPTQFFLEQDPQQYPHPHPQPQSQPQPPPQPQPDAQHGQPFAPAGWHSQTTPGSLTPTPAYDGYPTYDAKDHTLTYTHDPVRPMESQMYGGLPVEPGALFQPNNALSASPQSAQDWMSNSSNDHLDLHSVPKHLALASPGFNPNPPLLRRDGIRKKNARFEIPAERTLRTIDQLINQTTDEQEIKELKQQKRLLRNRQAALDSRQRKKQHTERLEEEKKQTSTLITDLEEALAEMRMREEQWEQQRESWQSAQQQYKQYIDDLITEKEEMIRCHTLETAELRKKNAHLTEQAQKLESISMSAVPSSTGFSADFSDFDHPTMQSSPWDNFSMVHDFSIEAEHKQETSLVVLPNKAKAASKDDDKAATSGLLLMLLLCGAWVASSGSTTSAPSIPTMPDDVRVASAAVLENIYKDAGLQPAELPHPKESKVDAKKTPSQDGSKTALGAFDFASLSTSPVASLHDQLITPSMRQQREQDFSLSADQYNCLTSDETLDEPAPPAASGRRNLGEALAAMRRGKQGSAAEVYTRSLMWDEVPTNVVRDFARMVAQCNAGNSRLDSREPFT